LGDIDPAGTERVAELVRENELGPWPPESPALQVAAEKIAELEKSDLVVSASTRRDQVDGIVDDTLAEIFTEASASRCGERFEEMAYVYWKWGREDDARACIAAADAFGGPAPAQLPLARAMLEVLLGPVLNRLDEGNAGSLNAEP
jgi:hypothetical protein